MVAFACTITIISLSGETIPFSGELLVAASRVRCVVQQYEHLSSVPTGMLLLFYFA